MSCSLDTFFNNHIFIHTHIEKCGGSTLLRHMTTQLGEQHVYDLRPFPPIKVRHILKQNPVIKKKIPTIRLLSGHLWYGTVWDKLFPNTRRISKLISPRIFTYCRKQPLYLASVRHPVERLYSFFRYLKTNPSHRRYSDSVKNNDFDAFIQELITIDHLKVKNGICTQLTHRRDSLHLLAQAKKSFNQHYLAIVPYDKTHELANMLAEALELPPVDNCIVNRSIDDKNVIARQETLALLEKRCSADIQLYSYILTEYKAKLAYAKEYLHDLLGKS